MVHGASAADFAGRQLARAAHRPAEALDRVQNCFTCNDMSSGPILPRALVIGSRHVGL